MFNMLIKRQYSAQNIDALNRTAVAEVDLQNGAIFALEEYSTAADEALVWKTKQLAKNAKTMWMASSPEIVLTKLADGTVLKGIDNNPRDFVNVAGHPIDAFKVCEGDILTFVASDTDTVIGKNILVSSASNFAFEEASQAPSTGLYLKKVGDEKIHIGDGSLRKTAVSGTKYQVMMA